MLDSESYEVSVEDLAGITNIPNYAFKDKKHLTSITIPDGVTTIYYDAFNGCSSLTNITIPNSVTTIDYSAFEDCTSLTSITMKSATPPSLGNNAFTNDTKLSTIIVPAGCGEAYKAATNWSKYADKIVEAAA